MLGGAPTAAATATTLALALAPAHTAVGTDDANRSRPHVRLQVSTPAHSPHGMRTVVAKGDVDRHPRRSKVRLARKRGNGWETVAAKRLPRDGAFRFKVTHRRLGVNVYRIRVGNRRGVVLATRRFRTHVHKFAGFPELPDTAPPGGMPPPPPASGGAAPMSRTTAAGVMGPLWCQPPYTTFYRPTKSGIWGNTWMAHAGAYYDENETLLGYSNIAVTYVDDFGQTYQWFYENGNYAQPETIEWNPGHWIAVHNLTVINGQQWQWEPIGWSPTTNADSGHWWCPT